MDWCPPPFQTPSGYVFQRICWLLPTIFQSMSLYVFGHPKSLALCQVLIQMYGPLVNGINGTKTFVECRSLEWCLHVLWVLPNQPNQWWSPHLGVHFPCIWTDEVHEVDTSSGLNTCSCVKGKVVLGLGTMVQPHPQKYQGWKPPHWKKCWYGKFTCISSYLFFNISLMVLKKIHQEKPQILTSHNYLPVTSNLHNREIRYLTAN